MDGLTALERGVRIAALFISIWCMVSFLGHIDGISESLSRIAVALEVRR